MLLVVGLLLWNVEFIVYLVTLCAWFQKYISFSVLKLAFRSVTLHTLVDVALVTGPLLFQQELFLLHPELQDPPWQGDGLWD